LHARPRTAVGKPATMILRAADEYDVTVIVLGVGRQGVLGGLLGSVAARVVHQAERPVLVIPECGGRQ
jgi:nucleotide-binding universal stress UspA family protein